MESVGEGPLSPADYRLLFDACPRPMWVFDVETLRFLAVNEAAVDLYGYSREEFLAMTIKDIRPAEDVERLLAAHAEAPLRPMVTGGWRHRKKDGSVIAVEISSCPLMFAGRRAELVLPSEVTQRLRLEEQLRQAQKMEAVGRLAGGIAHDFNNVLTAILGYSELGQLKIAQGEALDDELEEIRLAGERAAGLTRQLLAFSRRQVVVARTLDLGAVVGEMTNMLRRLIGEDVDLVTIVHPGPVKVKADRGHLEQVLMNLSVNARDAMPRGGRLTIEVGLVELDGAYAQPPMEVVPGEHVVLAVSDTGTGMDEEVRRHLFEPFFTTKESGSGLGLATVYGIVQQHQGSIWVYSEVGRGSTFKVYLPRAQAEDVEIVVARPTRPPSVGSEDVLLLEDEQMVRNMVERILQASGYRVLAASTVGEAEQLLREAGSVALVLTDVILPQSSGREAVERLRAIQPAVRVLYMSGYTEDTILRGGYLAEGVDFLQKPFTPGGLAEKVREVLDR